MSPELSALIGTLGRVLKTENGSDWLDGLNPHRWMALVHENALGPYLGARCLDGALSLPEPIERELIGAYVRSGHDASLWVVELPALMERFGVDGVLLKGGALALVHYDTVAERLMSDLDILIEHPSEASRAHSGLLEQGFSVGADAPEDHHHLPALIDPVRGLRIELHTNLSSPGLSEEALAGLHSRRVEITIAATRRLFVLEPVDRLLHHAVHAFSSPLDSPLLRNLFEIALLNAGLSQQERALLSERAHAWDRHEPAARAFGLASSLFGFDSPLETLEEQELERWCRERLEWTDAFSKEQSTKRRLEKRIAHRRVEDREGNNTLWSTVWGTLSESARSLIKRRSALVHTSEALSLAPIEGGGLVHDKESGGVHFVDGVCMRALELAHTPTTAKQLTQALKEEGVDAHAAKAIPSALLSQGLLLRSN